MGTGRGRLALAVGCCGALVGTAPAATQPEPTLRELDAVKNPNVCLADAGSRGWCGDGGLAGQARLAGPRDVAVLADGGYLIADTLNHVIRRVDGNNVITTVAGNAAVGNDGDGGPATDARLNTPSGVAVTSDGFVVADSAEHVVRRVSANGLIERFAGTGRSGTSGDGGPATAASLRSPRSVAVLDDGSVLIADADDHRVRRVTPRGTIVAFAGSGVPGTGGDGGPATAAGLREPTYVAPEPGGSVLVVDRGAAHVRRVATDGTITTVAGGELPSTPATALRLEFPTSVASTGDGGFLVAEAALVRQILPDGRTRVAAGTGSLGFTSGDLGAALATRLMLPAAVVWRRDGTALVADTSNDRIRRLNLAGGIRTIAGFDHPDQVLGVPSTAAGASAAVSRAGAAARTTRLRCTSRSRPGRYNVLRIRPSDPSTFRARRNRTLEVIIESSARARVRVTAHRSGVDRTIEVHKQGKIPLRIRPTHAGRFKLVAKGQLLDRPTATRCARARDLRVRRR